jgi:hypothetical protein
MLQCAFADFIPGSGDDPDRTRPFRAYLDAARANATRAGKMLFVDPPFGLSNPQVAKVEGDAFELLEAATLWNAMAAWNQLMDTGVWASPDYACPAGAVPTPARKVAVVKLPRDFDATRMFRDDVRRNIEAFEAALQREGMELGLSSPDIIGVRVPDPMPESYTPFLSPLTDLKAASRVRLEEGYKNIIGTLDGRSFLFAIAVKTSTRSDRLYQPLFEAMILKFLIGTVLRGAAFKFHVHMESFEGAAVEERYKAADLTSLLTGGAPRKAIDRVYKVIRPSDAAQVILDDLPSFPL